MRILTMVQDHVVSPEEGVRLLAALERSAAKGPASGPTSGPSGVGGASGGAGRGRWLRLRVEERGQAKVNLQLPLPSLPWLLRLVQPWLPEERQADLNTAAERIGSGQPGDLLLVDNPGAERVRIWVE